LDYEWWAHIARQPDFSWKVVMTGMTRNQGVEQRYGRRGERLSGHCWGGGDYLEKQMLLSSWQILEVAGPILSTLLWYLLPLNNLNFQAAQKYSF
jgi:hypothetical protein